MKQLFLCITLSVILAFSGCTIDDDCLDPDILAKFEQERDTNGSSDTDDLDDPIVEIVSTTIQNQYFEMTGKVYANGHKITEVGVVWNTSKTTPVPEPTYTDCEDRVRSSYTGSVLYAWLPLPANSYVSIRAYVINSQGDIFYSKCIEIMP